MKKNKLSIVLVVTFALLIGCSNNNTNNSNIQNKVTESQTDTTQNKVNESQNDTIQNKVNESQSNEPIADQNESEVETIKFNLNETISNDFMEVKFTSFNTSFDLKPTDTSGFYSYYEGEKGKQYFMLEGTFKNTGTFAEGPHNSVAKFIFDDKYEYSANIYTEQDNSLNSLYTTDPFETNRLVIAAKIPDELLNQYKTVKVMWGITECFSYTKDNKYSYIYSWDDVTTIYEMDATK